MNLRQKKKLFRKVTGQNPPGWMHYSSRRFHDFLCKPWGGLAALKKQEATRTGIICSERRGGIPDETGRIIIS